MATKSNPSETVIRKLFALSLNRCSFPKCLTPIVQASGTITGEICHIKARSSGGPRYDPKQTEEERNSFENLILLCSVHHQIVDKEPEKFTADLLQEIKEMHERGGRSEPTEEDVWQSHLLFQSYVQIHASGDAQVMVNSPGAIQVKNAVIKTGGKRAQKIQPVESIGADVEMRGYVGYLVKKYIDWRTYGITSGKDKRRFHPSMIHQWIERDFGTSTYYVHRDRFPDLIDYLQKAIDGTILGGIRLRKGERNYHSFEEHLRILRGEQAGGE